MIVKASAGWHPRGGCEQCERGQQGHAPTATTAGAPAKSPTGTTTMPRFQSTSSATSTRPAGRVGTRQPAMARCPRRGPPGRGRRRGPERPRATSHGQTAPRRESRHDCSGSQTRRRPPARRTGGETRGADGEGAVRWGLARSSGRLFAEVRCVDLDVLLPLGGNHVLGRDGVDRAGLYAARIQLAVAAAPSRGIGGNVTSEIGWSAPRRAGARKRGTMSACPTNGIRARPGAAAPLSNEEGHAKRHLSDIPPPDPSRGAPLRRMRSGPATVDG